MREDVQLRRVPEIEKHDGYKDVEPSRAVTEAGAWAWFRVVVWLVWLQGRRGESRGHRSSNGHIVLSNKAVLQWVPQESMLEYTQWPRRKRLLRNLGASDDAAWPPASSDR